jgi:uncharacterized protein
MAQPLEAAVAEPLALPLDDLVDHHCHGILTGDLDRPRLESMLNEAAGPSPLGTTLFDSMLGLALRRHCAPLLDLESLASADDYVARRTELGGAEVSARLMDAAGIGTLLVDTGIGPEELCGPGDLAALCGGRAREVVRLERLTEEVLARGSSDVAGEIEERLRHSGAVAAKSIAAYRVGLGLADAKPTDDAFVGALAETDPVLVAHPVVSTWLAHTALEVGLPLQVHTGYGDPDLTLHRAQPSLLTPFLRALPGDAASVVLLHCYPYHRQAAYLANVFPKVVLDVSLAVNHLGPRADAVLAETLELAPFGSLLYASDGFALAELHHLGAVLFRRGLGRVLDDWLAQDALSAADASRFARMITGDNARRVYALGPA